MGLFSLLFLLFIASIIGAIGASLAGRSSEGCLTSIVIGFIGALIGTKLSEVFGIRDFVYFYNIPIIWSVVGTTLFITILNLIRGD